jgi:uncharacterized protein (TIGR02118 family)
MVKVLLLFGNPMDRAGFDHYFEQTHRPLLAKLPDLKVLRINHVAGAVTGESPFYLVVGQTMAKDFSNFASGGVTVLLCHSQATSLT